MCACAIFPSRREIATKLVLIRCIEDCLRNIAAYKINATKLPPCGRV